MSARAESVATVPISAARGVAGKGRLPSGRTVITNSGVASLQQVIAVAISLGLVPLFLAGLGAEQFGVLLIVQMLSLSGLAGYVDFGLQNGVLRGLAAAHGRGDKREFAALLSSALLAFALLGLLAGLALFVLAGFIGAIFRIPQAHLPTAIQAARFYALAFVFIFPLMIWKTAYAARQNIITVKLWETIERLLYVVLVFVILRSGGGISAIVFAELALALAVGTIFVLHALRRYQGWLQPRPPTDWFRRMRGIVPLSAGAFANHLSTYEFYQRVPELLVATLLGPVQLTYLSIVSKLPRGLKSISGAVNFAVFSASAALDGAQRTDKVAEIAVRGARYGYLLLVPLIAFLIVNADLLLHYWVGQKHVFLAGLLRAFVVWYLLMFYLHFARATFTQVHQYVFLLRVSIAANLIFLGITALGFWQGRALQGIAAGLLICGAISVVGTYVVQRRSFGIGLDTLFGKVLGVPLAGTLLVSSLVLLAVRSLTGSLGVFAFPIGLSVAYGAALAAFYAWGATEGERARARSFLMALRAKRTKGS